MADSEDPEAQGEATGAKNIRLKKAGDLESRRYEIIKSTVQISYSLLTSLSKCDVFLKKWIFSVKLTNRVNQGQTQTDE